jgi:hypothetical protein
MKFDEGIHGRIHRQSRPSVVDEGFWAVKLRECGVDVLSESTDAGNIRSSHCGKGRRS